MHYEPGNPLEKLYERMKSGALSSGRTVTEMNPSDGEEYTVTFPPNRPSRLGPRRRAKRDLRAAYVATDFVFEAEGHTYILRIGEQNQQVRELFAKHSVQGAAYITACNPASLTLGDVHNTLAMRALRRDLSVRNGGRPWVVYSGAGQDRAGIWPPDPSLMVLGIDRAEAEALGRRYGQYAIVWIDEAGTPSLVDLADLNHASRYPLKNPPFKWIELGFGWGDEWADIRVSPSQWRRILMGEPLGLEAEGVYDGEAFTMHWDFDGGYLYVSYGDDGGTAYDGKLTGVSMSLP